MKISNPLLIIILTFAILLMVTDSVYSQKVTKGNSDGQLLKVRLPQPESNPFNSPHNGAGTGENDSPLGSISVNEDPYFNAMTPAQLVQQAFITGCLTASNVKFGYYQNSGSTWTWIDHAWNTPANRQMGYFQKSTSNFPIDEGIILTTGIASSAMGPNNTGNKSDLMIIGASDPDLSAISGEDMNDAAILEFDFVPAGNTMEFKYMFSSEEYLEYVQTSFNDAFGFFLSGPGISGPYQNNAVNLAVLPNGDPVTINTIHPAGINIAGQPYPAKNEEYYLDNPQPSVTYQFDGGTVVLTATYTVVPCQTYHIKLSVADAFDQEFDGAVFLAAKSFNSENLILTNYGNAIEGQNNVFEGCSDFFRIERTDPDISHKLKLDLLLSGTATNGVDIQTTGNQPFPNKVTIPANVSFIDIPYSAVSDGLSDNGETFIINIATSCPCAPNVVYVSKTINIYEQVIINSITSTDILCHNESNGTITVNSSGGSGNYEYSKNNGTNWQSSNFFSGLSEGTYTIKVRDLGSCYEAISGTATIANPPAIIANAGSSVTICNGQSTQLNGSGGNLYSWSPATGLSATNIANPIANPGITTTYTLTATNSIGQCPSTATVTVTVLASPTAAISPANPEICKGSFVTLTANGGDSYEWNPGGATTSDITVSPASNTSYTVTATFTNGCSDTETVNVVVKDAPALFNVTGGGSFCSGGSGIVVGLSGSQNGVSYQLKLNGSNLGSSIAGNGSAIAFGNQNLAGTYTIEATMTSTACMIPMSGNAVITVNPVPTAPTLSSITQPTCAVATGSIVLGGLPSGNWTINPGAIAGNTSTASLSGVLPGTYTYTVTNSFGCTSATSANIVVNAQPVTPSAPVLGTITQPTCAVATGSIVLNGLPAGSWTINPGAIAGTGTSKTISGLVAGTYNYTVTNSVGCTSLASANAVINTQPLTPSAPVVSTITQPTCTVATGSVSLSGLPSGNWIINPGAIPGSGASTTISNLAVGTYNFTVTNAAGCTSAASTSVVFIAAIPSAPLVGAITQPNCSLAFGNVVLSGLPSGNWIINPGAISGTGASTAISGIPAGTYTYTVTNAGGCNSAASASVVINTQPVTPSAPVVDAIAQPNCSVATGSVMLIGLPAGNWTLNPGAISGNTVSRIISGLSAGTYSYTVTNSAGCTSPASANIVINPQPAIPSAPTVGIITQPSCSVATGSVILNGLPAGSWTVNPGAIAGNTTSVTISGLAAGTYSYTVTQGCTSAASANIVINTQPVTPSAPVVGTITQPTCSVATGSVILNGLPTGSWTINPGAIAGTGTSKTISGLSTGTYNYTVTSAAGCTSAASANVVINTQPVTPSAPVVGAVTQPTCSISTGSVVLSGLPAGNWIINPGAISGTGASTIVTGLVSGTRTFTVTNSVGCTSAASVSVVINAQPVTPGAPVVGVITQPNCSNATGSVILSGLPSGSWTINPGAISGTGASTTISNLVPGTYSYTITNAAGCTSTASANIVIISHPGTPSAPTIGTITQPTCEVATGSVVLNGLPAGNWTINPGAITGSGPSVTITNLIPGTYNFTVTNSVGCTSLVSLNVVILPNPGAPLAPEILSITQPSCSVATGSIVIGGLPPGTWTIYPGGITGTGSTATIIGLLPGIYTFTVTNDAGCVSSASINVVINDQPETPDTPIVGSVTQPTCLVSTGSVVLSGLPAGNWVINPGAIAGTGASKTITSLSAGIYNFTVTNSVGCTSLPTANVVIIAATPSAPTLGTITQPTCSVSTGSVILNNLPAGNWIINPGAIAGTGSTYTKTGLVAGTYTFTVTNAMGCNSLPTPNIVVNAQPATPSAPGVGAITQPTCAVSTGSVVLSGLPAGNWTINPGAIAGTGSSYVLSGIVSGSYTYTVTNSVGCTSSSSANVIINAQPVTPSAPTVNSITQPTCEIATGSVTLGDLPAGNWIINPGAIAGSGASKTISGLVAGTYSYSVTNAVGCTSPLSADIVIVANPGTPAAPAIGVISQPTCSLSTGSVILNGLPAGDWTINPGAIAGNGTSSTVSGLSAGTYSFTVTNASGCISLSSANVVINTQPITPAAPTVGTITQPTCAIATGSVILNGLPAGTWTINPGAITGTGASKTISGIPAGSYNYTVTNSVGCTSPASANVSINTQPVTPSAPLIGTIIQPTCAVANGSVELTGLPSGNWTINPGTISGSGASITISNVPAGTRTYTVTNSVGCTSAASANVVINTQPVTPSAPIIGTITQPSCSLATGSIVLSGLPTGNWIINPGAIAGTGSSKTLSGLSAGTYNYTVTNAAGCTSSVSANAVINAQPATPSVPIVGSVVHPTCTVATGSVDLSGLPSGSWVINPGAIAGSGSSKTLSGLTTGSYNFTVTNAAGCASSATAAVVINAQPVTPAPPAVGTTTQPTCSFATGSIQLTGLPAGNWTINPGSITGNSSSTTFVGLVAGTYSYTVTNSVGCTSATSANTIINAQPATPSAPVVGTVTQPTCSVATGSVHLSGLPSGNWTINPGTITGSGLSTTLSGLNAGTYNYTVTNASGCTSATSFDIVINPQPVTPTAPSVGVVSQPTCDISTGSVILNGLPSGNWTINPGSITGNTSSTTISFLLAGTYNYSVTNSVGCTSPSSANVVINVQPATPSAPGIGTITQPSCEVATGSLVLVGLPMGNWTINPGAISGSGSTTTLTGLTPGTHSYTVTNAVGCTSTASADVIINPQPATPATPIVNSIIQPTCTFATASLELGGLPAGVWTINPGSVSGSTPNSTISGLVAGTYSYTVTNAAGCISLPTADIVIDPQPVTPATLTIGIITQPTCEVATGSVVLNNLPSGNWTINPGAITGTGSSATISDLPTGTYTFTVTNSAGCTSSVSANVVINGQPAIPATPIIASVTQPTCFIATGTVILSGLPNRNYVINPGGISGNTTSLTITGLTAGTYNFTVTKVGGCTSLPSASVVINPQPPTPPAPTLGIISQPLCAGSTGTINVTAPTGIGMTYSLDGSDYTNTSGIFALLNPGTYTVTAKSADGCISPGTNVTINPQPTDLTFTAPDITTVTCSGGNDGIIVIGAAGGTGSIVYSISPAIGTQSPAGTFNGLTAQTYSITAQDQNGCTKILDVSVGTVPDVTVPVINGCPINITKSNDAGLCSAVVTWTEPTATDNCTPSASLVWIKSHTPGSTFPVGTTTVTYTAQDAANNISAICSFAVTVTDNEIPVISGCPANITQSNDAGLCSAVVSWIEPAAADNCTPSAGLVWTKSHTPGSTFPVGTTTVTYTARDAANNISAICSFTVTVTDNEIPAISGCPVNITQSNDAGLCSAVVTWIEPTATDNCTPSASLVWTKSHTPGSNFPVGTTTVTYTARDVANNISAICSFTVTVTDNEIPAISGCPVNLTQSNDAGLCSAVVTWIEPTATDNCTPSANLVWTKSHTPGSTFPVGTTTVTYTARDAANNISLICSFTVAVTDNEIPVISGCPVNITQSNDAGLCSAVVTWIEPTATDNCTPSASLVWTKSHTPGSTFPVGTTTIVYIAQDAANNISLICSFTVTVTDNQNPTISGPGDVTVFADLGQCYATAVALGTPITTDNCGIASVTNNAPVQFPVGETTVIWTVTDLGGLTATSSQTVTVIDNQPPTIICPATITVNSNAGLPYATGVNLGTPTTADNCGVQSVINNAPAQFPVGSTIVTWTVTDINGLTATCTQTIIVSDAEAPVMNCPPAISVNCIEEVPAAYTSLAEFTTAGGTATDNNGIDASSFQLVSQVSDNQSCPETITRIYSIADTDGNSSTCAQLIVVNDIIAPVIDPLPAATTIDCPAIPVFANATATDNCVAAFTLNSNDVTTPGTCAGSYSVTRTWTATDACGNSSTASQTINVQDITAPAIICPSSISVQTDPGLNTATVTLGQPVVSDDCGAVSFTNDFNNTTNASGIYPLGLTVVTWTATDACGNTASCQMTVTVNDTEGPAMNCPPAISVNCIEEVPAAYISLAEFTTAGGTATDNNGINASSFQLVSQVSDNQSCPETITRIYSIADTDGNSSTCAQLIIVNDIIAPVIDPLPAATTIDCPAVPVFANATATDNCVAAFTLTSNDVTTPGTCAGSYSVTRTWTATDACGNSSTASQTINVQDITAPAITCPPSIAVQTDPGLNTATVTIGQPVVSDDCGAVSFTNDFNNTTNASGIYPLGLTVVAWTATDACGNTASCQMTVTVNDAEGPAMNCPPAISVNCIEEVPAAYASLAEFTTAGGSATDNNGINASSFQLVSQVSDNQSCPETITRIYSIADTDGNSSTCAQLIIVNDIIAPVIDPLPATTTIDCPSTPVFANATATDNCVAAFTLTSNDVTTPGTCAGSFSVTRTWTATDACGNSSTTSQTINVQDITAPVIDALPATSTIDCPVTPEFAVATATDACGSDFALTFNDVTTSGACTGSYSITRTWTATDACGNSSTALQTINVQDITAPVIGALPATGTIDCPATPEFAVATATDACGSDFALTFNDVNTSGTCTGSYSITRTWTATDACGNSSTASQTINVQDITAPVIDALPATSTIDCPATPEFAVATATDACGSDFALTFNDVTTPGTCTGSYNITRTWTATDACGNSSTASQTINVQDITAPVIDALPATSTIDCPATPEFAVATATDACGSDFALTFNDVTTSGACAGSYSITRTWTATDACGNSSTATQTINVQDITAPDITCAPDITINSDLGECGATVNVPQPEVIENCGSVTYTNSVNQTANASGFYPVGITTVDWTLTDECGNISTCSMTITVSDNEAPLITCPSDVLVCTTEPVVLGVATASDNCEIASIINNAPTVFEPGTTLVTWTATDIHGNTSTCTQTVVIIPMAIANAGQDALSCESQPFTLSTASALNYSSVSWTTNGQGSVINASTLNPTYIPLNGETGNVFLTLTVYGIVPCASVTDQMLLTILPTPVVTAGPDANICEGQSFITVNAFAGYTGSIHWTTSGTGTFTDPTLAITTYNPSFADISNGSVILTLTGTGTPPCENVSDNMTLTISKSAVANAGIDASTCQNLPFQISDATAQNYASVAWTHNGQGSITGANTLTPTYTPATDETGVVSFTFTAFGISPCGNSVDIKNLSIYRAPSVSAGADFKSCDATPVHLASATVSGVVSVEWTSTGSGNFDNPTLVNATYTPCQSDVENGSVTLTLTATGNANCGTAYDQVIVTLIPAAKVFAGDGNTICSGTSYLISDATVEGATSLSWTHDGLGILQNAETINPTYIPAPAESGKVHLFVIATGQMPCGSVTDSLTLQVIPGASANAGSDIQSCLSVPVQLNAIQVSGYNSVLWSTSGTGSFNNTTILNPVYTPSLADMIDGFVEISLQAFGNAPCGNSTDVLRIDFIKAPVANAGEDTVLCTVAPYTISSATASDFTSVIWSHNGNGSLSDPTVLNPTYIPAPGETGTVEFTLTVNGSPACSNMVVADLFVLTLNPAIIVNAGSDESIASGAATALSGTVSGGTGVFTYTWSPEELIVVNNILNPNTQVLTSEVVFTLTVQDVVTGCSARDDVKISMGGIIRPIAKDDYDTTGLNSSTLVNVVANDSDPIGLGLDVTIISDPKNGIAILNEDGSITYNPLQNFTGNDTLTYMICDRGTPSKCATAKLIITIFPERELLEIYNLVIPNGDGMNDTWFIRGIENYPDNSVMIFNRWGDKLRDFTGYNNTSIVWDGTNYKGEKLPAGTYYYVLKLNDADSRTGWILLRWNE